MGNVKVTIFQMSVSKIPLLVFNRYSPMNKDIVSLSGMTSD